VLDSVRGPAYNSASPTGRFSGLSFIFSTLQNFNALDRGWST
jgi:hypothetical protein